MYINIDELTPSQAYFTLIQSVIPRPIAWVLSENASGTFNLAPFSYFNMICSDPPLLMISVGKKPDGAFKDTRVNIEQRPDYVIHIAHRAMLESLNASSATLPAEVSELNQIGLSTAPFPGSRLPRIEGCRLAFACTRHSIQEIGAVPQSLILGRVKAVYLDDMIIGQDSKGRLKVHADRLDPITRLGGSEYATFGEIVSILRPK